MLSYIVLSDYCFSFGCREDDNSNTYCFFITKHARASLGVDELPDGFYEFTQMPCHAVDLFVEYTKPDWVPFRASSELHHASDGINSSRDLHYAEDRVVGVVCSICVLVAAPDSRLIGFLSARLTDTCWWLENAVFKHSIGFVHTMQMMFEALTELNANS